MCHNADKVTRSRHLNRAAATIRIKDLTGYMQGLLQKQKAVPSQVLPAVPGGLRGD